MTRPENNKETVATARQLIENIYEQNAVKPPDSSVGI